MNTVSNHCNSAVCGALGTQQEGVTVLALKGLPVQRWASIQRQSRRPSAVPNSTLVPGEQRWRASNSATAGKSGRAPQGRWHRSRALKSDLELANQTILWAHSMRTSFIILLGLVPWAFASITSDPHNLNPAWKSLLSPSTRDWKR